MLGCGLKTAWHLGHRIREMMNPDKSGPVGGEGKTVEADDMEMGRSPKTKRPPRSQRPKNVRVLSLVERGGPIRSMVIDHRGIGGLFYSQFDPKSRLVSDSAPVFKFTGAAEHEAVDHSKYEWVRGDVHTQTLDGFFSIFKRVSSACTNTLVPNTLIDTSPSSISDRTPAPSLASMTCNVKPSPSRAQLESGSRTKQLIAKPEPKPPFQLEFSFRKEK
jgi:hypothetical protein